MKKRVRHIILYGSLRRGQPAFNTLRLARALRRKGRVRFAGMMVDLGPYPGVTLGGRGLVVGELFEILEPEVLRRLDAYEDYDPADESPRQVGAKRGSLYLRRVVLTAGGLPAWVYEYNGVDIVRAPRVAHGDWLKRLRSRVRK